MYIYPHLNTVWIPPFRTLPLSFLVLRLYCFHFFPLKAFTTFVGPKNLSLKFHCTPSIKHLISTTPRLSVCFVVSLEVKLSPACRCFQRPSLMSSCFLVSSHHLPFPLYGKRAKYMTKSLFIKNIFFLFND